MSMSRQITTNVYQSKNLNNNNNEEKTAYTKPAVSKKPEFLLKSTKSNGSGGLQFVTPSNWSKFNSNIQTKTDAKHNIEKFLKDKSSKASMAAQPVTASRLEFIEKKEQLNPTTSVAKTKMPVAKSRAETWADRNTFQTKEAEKRSSAPVGVTSRVERRSKTRPKTPGVQELRFMFEKKSESSFEYGQHQRRSLGPAYRQRKSPAKKDKNAACSDDDGTKRNGDKEEGRRRNIVDDAEERRKTRENAERKDDTGDENEEDKSVEANKHEGNEKENGDENKIMMLSGREESFKASLADAIMSTFDDDDQDDDDVKLNTSSSFDATDDHHAGDEVPAPPKDDAAGGGGTTPPSGYLSMSGQQESYLHMEHAGNKVEAAYYDAARDDDDDDVTSYDVTPPPLPANNTVGRRSKSRQPVTTQLYEELPIMPADEARRKSQDSHQLQKINSQDERVEDFGSERNKSKRRSLFNLIKKNKTRRSKDVESDPSYRKSDIEVTSDSTSSIQQQEKEKKTEKRTTSRKQREPRSCNLEQLRAAEGHDDEEEEALYEVCVPPELPERKQSLLHNRQPPTLPPRDYPKHVPVPPPRNYPVEADTGPPPPIPPKDVTLHDDDEEDDVDPNQVVPAFSVSRNRGKSFVHSEPLYQVYHNNKQHFYRNQRNKKSRTSFKKAMHNGNDQDWESEFGEDMNTSTLWKEIPEVAQSTILRDMTPQECKLQQAQFEVITSQASYLRSLNVLVNHFYRDSAMQDNTILSVTNRRVIFSNIEKVRDVEQRFLRELENHFWNELRLSRVCDVILQFCKSDFDVYELYIQNQVFQERKLHELQKNDDNFVHHISRLESSSQCRLLNIQSFLLLPFQRACRLPLLVEAIVKCADGARDNKLLARAKCALAHLNRLVKKCNDSARKMQNTEEMAELGRQFVFPSQVKTFAIISQNRYVVKKGEVQIAYRSDAKKNKFYKLSMFLFNDVLFICRKKTSRLGSGGVTYEVVDWAKRNLMFVNEHAKTDKGIFLILLENHAGARVEMTLQIPSQNEHSRWLQALIPQQVETDGEKIYEEWDCPQVICTEPYQAIQPDEMSIDVGDVMKVTKKTDDGWWFGCRLRDAESGWIPQEKCDEIEDEHMRARNMKLQYTYLTSSSSSA